MTAAATEPIASPAQGIPTYTIAGMMESQSSAIAATFARSGMPRPCS